MIQLDDICVRACIFSWNLLHDTDSCSPRPVTATGSPGTSMHLASLNLCMLIHRWQCNARTDSRWSDITLSQLNHAGELIQRPTQDLARSNIRRSFWLLTTLTRGADLKKGFRFIPHRGFTYKPLFYIDSPLILVFYISLFFNISLFYCFIMGISVGSIALDVVLFYLLYRGGSWLFTPLIFGTPFAELPGPLPVSWAMGKHL